ncbi:MAG: hypothetical protein HKP32_06085 [Woeseia sp.]|nr:hypothetical protein [Woeseia sp.]MBT8096424.1 hypothetical protein [Woeseia sp.]NNL54701.1 hypothetical protein [Woeseia sp.]
MDSIERQSTTLVAGQTGLAVPLIVGVTGHRDLVAAEVPGIRTRVRTFLKELLADYPERGITVMSALAEGADQLVAEEALALGIPVIAPLPMPLDLYLEDFAAPQAQEKFQKLHAQAREVFELPITEGNAESSIKDYGDDRNLQYAQLGVFLCAHCHILLALWDGKVTDQLGGTGQVVRFHHDDVMPGYTPSTAGGGLLLSDDESDLVFHIVCSRNRKNGAPEPPLKALDWWWYTLDNDSERTKSLPERHQRVFNYSSEFSKDAVKHQDLIRDESWSLLPKSATEDLPPGLHDIDQVFCAADWLAIFYQKRLMRTLRIKHLIALMMGLLYILYSDLRPSPFFLYAFLGLFLAATGLHWLADRRGWHRKYLDYRTLAEGLRVQFYWAASGVRRGKVSKFAHDNFLQTQDPDLGWIRNVMRAAGIECDAANYNKHAGLAFALREWLGDENTGQLGYYRRKGEERLRRHRNTQVLSNIVFWIGFVSIALFIVLSPADNDRFHDPLVVLMGIMLLLVGIRQSYSFSMGDAELLKQYRFMRRIFANARRRVMKVDSDSEKRRVLRVLGNAALDENAQWILMHRERALDQGEVFRMSG